jgi:hypothetical protein
VERRHLTKGQRAVALAMMYPEPGSRTKKDAAKAAESSGFSTKRLREARSVLRHSRELAESVLKGSATLDAALVKKVEEERRIIDVAEAARVWARGAKIGEQAAGHAGQIKLTGKGGGDHRRQAVASASQNRRLLL